MTSYSKVNVAREVEPNLPGNSRVLPNPQYSCRFDASKAAKLLGVEYTSMEETAREILSQFREVGWIA